MECDNCGTQIEDDDINFIDDIPYCEECYRENVDKCAICEEEFPRTKCDTEGEYYFVFWSFNKKMKPGIYRADEFPFWWNIMFSDPTIIESAVTWVAPIPSDDCYSGKICKECIEKYCKNSMATEKG